MIVDDRRVIDAVGAAARRSSKRALLFEPSPAEARISPTISLDGASGARLWTDERQNRLDTVTARSTAESGRLPS
ncbi:hypothetical protein [Phreatobacter stygius]|uniref:Uncharacterized protein n=1 Tax=Phreatobacter stygius TaxID=1940610 RepID=A0A4D7AUY6_9HYPH|nr:hypothetical protein [Phreatobacter stygius]QCI62823.1 hypothetical protein E8M01_00325 [Phreatobacter stygius]